MLEKLFIAILSLKWGAAHISRSSRSKNTDQNIQSVLTQFSKLCKKNRITWALLEIKVFWIFGVKSIWSTRKLAKNYWKDLSEMLWVICNHFWLKKPIRPLKSEFSPDNYDTPSNWCLRLRLELIANSSLGKNIEDTIKKNFIICTPQRKDTAYQLAQI